MTPERIAEIRALLDAATPGPWQARYDVWIDSNDEKQSDPFSILGPDQASVLFESGSEMSAADFDLVTAAPTIIAELLADHERWQESLASVVAFNDVLLADLRAENERLQRALANAAMRLTDTPPSTGNG